MNADQTIQEILAHVHAQTGLDFGTYRPGTIERRVHNRMTSLAIDSRVEYLRRLRSDAGEAASLAERLTIKVSRFYRNAPAFDLLRGTALPELARRHREAPLSLWCAGCARGEEAYTLAMLLEEAGLPGTVLATDIDEGALEAAARALYPESAFQELPPALRRFVTPAARARHLTVTPEVRERVCFRQENLCEGPATRRFALVSCRNVLIYLEREAQLAACLRLKGALEPGGYLLLGEAEWPPLDAAAGLVPLNHRARLFRAGEASP